MTIDANRLTNRSSFEAEICIIGAGVAGIALAHEFVGQETEVIIVESGDVRPQAETQSLAEGDNVGRSYYPLTDACKRAIGGTSWSWRVELPGGCTGVRLRALDRIDFEERPGIPYSGWPISKQDLHPYYTRAHEKFHLGPYDLDAEDWFSLLRKKQTPIVEDRDIETAVFHFADASLFTDTYPRVLEEASNVTILTNATATELITNEAATTVTNVEARNLSGQPIKISGSCYILALGGIQTPRLLLLSNQHMPEGLANQNDLVGRFFMEHPHDNAGWYVPSKVKIGESLASYQRPFEVEEGQPIMAYWKPKAHVLMRKELPNYCASIRPKTDDYWRIHVSEGWKTLRRLWYARESGLPEQPYRDVARAVAAFPELVDIAYEKIRQRVNAFAVADSNKGARNYRLQQMSEQIPNPESRITLSPERDRFDQPRACLEWKLSNDDIRGIQKAQEIIDQTLQRAGLGHVVVASQEEINNRVIGGYHHMGTTRMGSSPRRGVVDTNCKVHGVHNLYVAGSSVFPTSGCSNPTLTIVALALRLADHLKRSVNPVSV
jgi:choline dehydrogenase-like flavoprotein